MRFTKDTEVIYYDVSSHQLEAKRWCVENWDGWDLERYINDPNALGISDGEWKKQILKFFGSKEEWLKHWDKYKKLHHRYILCDITKQPEFLHIYNYSSTVIWFSNIFNYRPYVSRHYLDVRIKEYNHLKKTYSKCVFLGQRPQKYH